MGRPRESGLKYYRFYIDTLLFDPEMKALYAAQGTAGVLVWLALRSFILMGDYYLPWPRYKVPFMGAFSMASERCVDEALRYLLRAGLLDADLYEREGILTSEAIQLDWLDGSRKKKGVTIIREYWLLGDELPKGFVWRTQKQGFCQNNEDLCGKNGSFGGVDKTRLDDTPCVSPRRKRRRKAEASEGIRKAFERNWMEEFKTEEEVNDGQ